MKLKKLLLRFGILNPKKEAQKKIDWASEILPIEETEFFILQPENSYPFIVHKNFEFSKDRYKITGYGRTRSQADEKLSVLMKVWLSKKEKIKDIY